MELNQLDPEVRRRVERFLGWLRHYKISHRVTSAFRSIAEQRALYEAWLARGRTGLPAAPPGQSTHNFGYAIDLALDDERWRPQVSRLAECAGLKWAGPGDRVHYDVWGPAAWRALLANGHPVVSYRC